MLRLITAIICLLCAVLACLPANALTVVPPGNRSATQPSVPGASARRTAALKTTYEEKYQKVHALLESDAELRRKIETTAEEYGIDPMHIVGAIVGEHTYNVDAYDRLQTYYVKALAYLGSSFTFEYDGEDVDDFVHRPQFDACKDKTGSYEVWTCREDVWNKDFRSQTVDGKSFPDDRFSAVFFQPFYAGQTFGLGQLNPLTALQMSDIVNETSGLRKLNYRWPQEVYQTIMDPDISLAYVAATLKMSIDAYKTIAGFDISGNPGITATLYNLGNPEARARALKKENDERRARGEKERLPRENYYGWLVNEKLDDLRALF